MLSVLECMVLIQAHIFRYKIFKTMQILLISLFLSDLKRKYCKFTIIIEEFGSEKIIKEVNLRFGCGCGN